MADVEALVAALTLEEKAALTAGADFWSTVAIPRLGIPSVRVTDGPNGARGASFGSGARPSVCTPCGSALGASWSPALVEQVGALIARGARGLGCQVLLAPTLNLHRSPLAGRNFECYSEDPLLAGRIATAYVRGVQSEGVIATVKHFVGNDAEHERYLVSSVIDERALRELYLVPFELAVRDGGALAVMTSYNRVNGRWVTESPHLLMGLLRDEWGFEGLVMTDWLGIAGTIDSSGAGLDLEMPGPGRAYGPKLAEAAASGSVFESTLDDMVRRILATFDRVGALDHPLEPEPHAVDRAEDRALMREAAAECMVLLRNDGVLPLAVDRLRRVAVIGPNADDPAIMGGGSAQLTPHYVATPVEALREALGASVELVHEPGCTIRRSAAALGQGAMAASGFTLEVLDCTSPERPVTHTSTMGTAEFLFLGPPPGATDDWAVRISGQVMPTRSGQLTLTLAQLGRARVHIDGELLLDGVAHPPPPGGTDFIGFGSTELGVEHPVVAGRPIDVVMEYRPDEAAGLFAAKAGYRVADSAEMFERAVKAARDADVAVVVVGTTGEWERETFDRQTMHLPGRQDELVRAVAAVNPDTVVIVNAGSPVDLSWADDVNALLQCWFGGQDLAGGLADVLVGAREPGGRLPTTIPLRVEHNPSHDNFPGENGELRYGESIFMGYRGYDHRVLPARFAFGHGLSYTTFSIAEPQLSTNVHRRGARTTVAVEVTNTGDRRGSEVVQLYVAPTSPRLARPPKELKAFAKVTLDPGERTTVDLELDDRAFAYWDPGQPDWEAVRERLQAFPGGNAVAERRNPGWQVDAGRYELLLARSATDIVHTVAIAIED